MSEAQPFASCTFIINPSRFPEYAKILKRILKRTDVPSVIESTSKEHFVESVRDFCRGDHRHLLVWGGDGTAHDAINTITNETLKDSSLRRRKTVGFLRGGSGNGIQDSYEVPLRIRSQLKAYFESVENEYTIDVDLLETECNGDSSYCQLVGFGFDADLLRDRSGRVHRMGKRKGEIKRGVATYLKSALKTFIRSYAAIQENERSLDLYDGKYAFRGTRVNAEIPFDFFNKRSTAVEIEVGSRPYYGRLFKICPDVVCNDGCLDVYVFNFTSRFLILANALWLWLGRHDRINKKLARGNKAIIERFEVKRVVISSAKPFDYHVDGEVRRTAARRDDSPHQVSIRVLPRQISFLVPPAFYRKFHPFD